MWSALEDMLAVGRYELVILIEYLYILKGGDDYKRRISCCSFNSLRHRLRNMFSCEDVTSVTCVCKHNGEGFPDEAKMKDSQETEIACLRLARDALIFFIGAIRDFASDIP